MAGTAATEEFAAPAADDMQSQMAELDDVTTSPAELDELDSPAPPDSEAVEAVAAAEPEKNDVEAREIVTPEEAEPSADAQTADKPLTPEEAKKLREQIDNLNGALREERNMRKKAQEEARQAASRPVAPVQAPELDAIQHGTNENESDIDPDVERTITRAVAPKISALEQTIRLNRYQLDEIRVSQEFGAKEFADASAAFTELINPESEQFDPGMLKAFQESDRPAMLAFNMGRARSIDAMLEKARSSGREEGRLSVMEDLKTKGKTIPSLSTVGGSSQAAAAQATGMRKELDEL